MSDSEEQQHHQSTLPAPAAAAALSAVKNAILKSQSPPTDPSTATTPSDSLSEEPQTIEAGLIDPNQDLTVFDSVTAFTVRHPLYARWQLWFDSASKQDKAKSWDEALVKVISFDSVEEFWGLASFSFSLLVPPSPLRHDLFSLPSLFSSPFGHSGRLTEQPSTDYTIISFHLL